MLMTPLPRALIAGGTLTAAAVAVLIVVMWPVGGASQPQPPPTESRSSSEPPLAAQFPAPPAAASVTPKVTQDGDSAQAVEGEDGARTLCDGCLSEQAVLDVVETYLRHLDSGYLQGDVWAHPLADIAPETPGQVDGQPKLPTGLLGAPEHNPFGMTIDTRSYPVDTTWIVWVQTGWVPREAIEKRILRTRERSLAEMRASEPINFDSLQTAVEEIAPGTVLPDDHIVRTTSGDLPEVALSWPPIKEEAFVAVDSRTGELHPDGIFSFTSVGVQPPYPAHYEAVLDATRERVARWRSGGGSELGVLPEPT